MSFLNTEGSTIRSFFLNKKRWLGGIEAVMDFYYYVFTPPQNEVLPEECFYSPFIFLFVKESISKLACGFRFL